MEERMAKLEAHILGTEVERSNIPKRTSSSHSSYHTSTKSLSGENTLEYNTESSQIATLNLSCSLGAFPASSMINFTLSDPRDTSSHGSDLISSRIIPPEVAESLVTFYKSNMNSFAYDIITDTDSLGTLSARSSLLTVAVCTVAAFCSGSPHYKVLIDYLKNEISGKVFSNNHEFDDVRALCIGALWLNEVSTALNSLGMSH